ncbi:TlpA family protein disulfide reductase [Thermospira aquatica]|uniref:TlpA family protein disulfide reductase n=1 Tax=Thermospira aquatica TaxID=2828656 RepID=A0AAX3BF83_9SPIR|nr:TlpA disulfide reductase family protein [Thermospira aquatica]URA11037.1 TlpA family protein disulfide reductase [Thermospira aquatica]
MKRYSWLWIGVVVVVVAGIVGVSFSMSKRSAAKEYPLAPLFSEPTIFGDSIVRLEAYRGKVVLLNFWATWCPPCQAEIPDLVRLYQDFGDRLVVIGISLDRGPNAKELVQDFYKQFKMNYPVVMGSDQLAMRYGGISGIPTSFVIDKQGRIVEKIVGFRNYSIFLDAVKTWF